MKSYINGRAVMFFLIAFFFTNSLSAQSKETSYTVNEVVQIKGVKKNVPINWGTTHAAQRNSLILIKEKSDTTFYIKLTVNGQFGYGGYFKYLGIENNEYKYLRTDGTSIDYLFLNFSLKKLSESNNYAGSIIWKMVCYNTSEGIMLKF